MPGSSSCVLLWVHSMTSDTHNLIWPCAISEALWRWSQVLSSPILRPAAQCLAHRNLCKYLPIICSRLEEQVWSKPDMEYMREENQGRAAWGKGRIAQQLGSVQVSQKQILRSGERWSERPQWCKGATNFVSGASGNSFQLDRGWLLTQADNWSLQGPKVLKEKS